jgi:sterol desaturase/sphingolipid hydroxylase (fatty acid hydroxylase superfamily)
MVDLWTSLLELISLQSLQQLFSYASDKITTMAISLAKIGLVFFFLVEILKRFPGFEDRKNFRLVHTERPFFNKEFFSEMCFPLFNWVIGVPAFILCQVLIFEHLCTPNVPHQALAPTIQALPVAAQVVIGLVVLDLSLYIRHRFVHHFFWPYHTVHHSAREISWITWLRLHPFDTLVMGFIDTGVLYLLGFGGEAFLLATAIKSHFNQFNHSNIQLDFGWPLRYILVSPNMHRWHHAADDPKAINQNFCIVFAWIDLLFGTYYVPKNRLPGKYGVCDEDGNQVVGTGYLEQIAYPFVHHYKVVKGWLGVDEKAKDEAADPVAKPAAEQPPSK